MVTSELARTVGQCVALGEVLLSASLMSVFGISREDTGPMARVLAERRRIVRLEMNVFDKTDRSNKETDLIIPHIDARSVSKQKHRPPPLSTASCRHSTTLHTSKRSDISPHPTTIDEVPHPGSTLPLSCEIAMAETPLQLLGTFKLRTFTMTSRQ